MWLFHDKDDKLGINFGKGIIILKVDKIKKFYSKNSIKIFENINPKKLIKQKNK